MLKHRAENLDIRCPIAGVVVRGDARRRENARLSMGDTLFEIAPLEKMVVDVFVQDEDVSYVRPGQEVKIRLDAFPSKPRLGTLERLNPQAEFRGQQNVFVAKVALDNADGALRPGMAASCQVATARRPLGWNLFHRAWDHLVFLLAW
jgi:multidrug resistance efflux pump